MGVIGEAGNAYFWTNLDSIKQSEDPQSTNATNKDTVGIEGKVRYTLRESLDNE
jgi:hypothetical protein